MPLGPVLGSVLGSALSPALGEGVGVPAPVNSVAPAITGSTSLGALLTCSAGTWSGSPTYAYQWTRNGVDIGGATASTYTLVTADTARDVNCRVTATNAGGSTARLAAAVSIPAPELVTNGTFSAGTDWGAMPSGWAIGSGVVTTTAAAAFSNIAQAEDQFEAGETYVVSYDMTAWTSGTSRLAFAGGTQRNGSNRGAVGSYTEELVANTGNNSITLFAIAAGSSWSIDDLSIKKKVVPGP